MPSTSSEIPARIPFVVPLHDLARTDLATGGGKGANLGELLRAGFPVPPGFAITTAAYERFVEAGGLGRTIQQELSEPQAGAAAIRKAFEAAPFPEEIARAVLAAYQALGQGPVAVRSSATAEDLPEAAFAGQQDTFLNVTDSQALLEAVRRCWASLWTDRAVAYRQRQGLDQAQVRLAVVVQRMAAAAWAGVLFTANPVTGARDEFAVDASPGLGEAVVAGLVTPDHFILRRWGPGWRVVERRAGRREVIVRARYGGGTEQATLPGGAALPALPGRALRRLASLGTAIQDHFGAPQDVEWAWDGRRVWILQARPVTALPAPPPRANILQRLVAANFAEMLPVRPYPLDITAWIPALGGAVEPLFALLGFHWEFRWLFETEDGVVVRFIPRLPRPTWRLPLAPFRMAALARRYNPQRWADDPLMTDLLARARQLEARDLPALSWEQLLVTAQEAGRLPPIAGEVRRRYFPRSVFAMARLRLLLGLLGESGRLAALLSGANNKTLEMNQALEALAGQVRADPGLARLFAAHPPGELRDTLSTDPSGRAFLASLQSFFDRYGHRETTLSTALHPTWKDSPEVALGTIKAFAAAPPPPPPAGKAAWEPARDAILRRGLLRIAPLRSAFLSFLDDARMLLPLREDTHFYATLALTVFHRVFLEMGRRLARAGILAGPEDVFHLTLAELAQAGDGLSATEEAGRLRAAVTRRKARRAALEGEPLVDPRLMPRRAHASDALLVGMPGSPGSAQGPARIIRDSSEFSRLAVGDVLVAPYTNPSWTPLFQRAAAVVVDSGSPASHAAIVAREYRIPAVMATVTGTQVLRDGEIIRVDGSRGEVYRVSEGP